MELTPNYALKKPAGNDYCDISVLNNNADVIDEALKGLRDGKAELGSDGKVLPEQLPEMDYEGPLSLAGEKQTPADGDSLALVDAQDESKTKRLLWSRAKQALADYFNALYSAVEHVHGWGSITDKPNRFIPSAHAASHGVEGSDPIALESIGAAAESHSHDERYFTQEQTLTQTTAALLGGCNTPDEALGILGRFHGGLGEEYLWERWSDKAYQYGSDISVLLKEFTDSTVNYSLFYGEDVVYSNGNYSIVNARKLDFSVATYQQCDAIKGKFFVLGQNSSRFAWRGDQTGSTKLQYIGVYGDLWHVTFGPVKQITSITESAFSGYVNAPDPTAYPPTPPDGYVYKPLASS